VCWSGIPSRRLRPAGPRPGPGRVVLAAGGLLRVVEPKALPAGGERLGLVCKPRSTTWTFHLTALVTVAAPDLVALPGVGVDTARLCGAAPIPVSSGRTDRHRLHRGGDRDANSALWRVALVRMRCHHLASTDVLVG